MSQVIDTKVVEMQFDNSKFEKNIEVSLNSLKNLTKSIDDAGKNRNSLNDLAKASDQVGISFDNMSQKSRISLNLFDMLAGVGTKAFNRISDAVAGFALNMANSLSGMQAMRDGFAEYELKMGSVQTILAGAKIERDGKLLTDEAERLEVVNQKLDELNTYSDKTIYSFKDMTANIGKFTNAGVNLDDSVAAIQGVANVAAISGANSQEASRAMYNFSQALAQGSVKLIDWKSINNANMGTMAFKQNLLDTALALKTVRQEGDHYISTTMDMNGKVSDAITSTKGFEESLSHQWLTTEVLTQTLKNYSTDVREMTDGELEDYKKSLLEIGYTSEQVAGIIETSKKAFDAATEVKTFTQMIDTLKESLGSGWAETWQIVFGDFLEAKQLWTGLNNTIDGMLKPISKARNAILQMWKDNGGRDAMIESFKNLYQAVQNLFAPLKELWKAFTPDISHTGKGLATISKWLEKITGLVARGAKVVGKVLAVVLKPVIFAGNLIGKVLMRVFGLIQKVGSKVAGIFSSIGKTVSAFSDKVSAAFDKHITSRIRAFQTTLSKTFDTLKKRVKESKALNSLIKAFHDLSLIIHDLFGRVIVHAMMYANHFALYLKRIWEAIQPLISNAFTAVLKALANLILPRLRRALGFVTDKLKEFGDFLGKIDLTKTRFYKTIAKLPDRIKAITSNKTFKNAFSGIKKFGAEALTFLSGKFDSLKKSIDAIKMPKGLKDVFNNIRNFIKGIFGAESVGEKVATAAGAIGEAGKEGFAKAKDLTLFQKFLTAISDAFNWLKTSAEKATTAVVNFIKFIVANTPKAIKAIHTFLAGDDGILTISDALDAIDIVSHALSTLFMSMGVQGFSKSIGGIGEAFGELTTSLNNFLKQSANNARMEAIKNFAIAIGILAGALYILAKIPKADLLGAVSALGIVGLGLVKFFDMISSTDFTGIKVAGNLSIAALLTSIGVAMIGIATSIGMLVGALAIFPRVIKQYNNLGDEFEDGMKRVGDVMAKIFEYLDHSINGKYALRSAASIYILARALEKLRTAVLNFAAVEDDKAWADGILKMQNIMYMLGKFLNAVLVGGFVNFNVGINFNTVGIAAMIWALGDMLEKIVPVVQKAGQIPSTEVTSGLDTIGKILWKIGVFLATFSVLNSKVKIGSFASGGTNLRQWIGASLTIALISNAIGSIVGNIDTLAKLATGDNAAGYQDAIETIQGIFIGLMALMAIIGKFKPSGAGTLFTLSVSIGILTLCVMALVPLAKAPNHALMEAVGAVGGLMIALGGALWLANQAAAKANLKNMLMLIVMAGVMYELSRTLKRLAKAGDPGSLIGAAAALGIAVFTMVGAVAALNAISINPMVLGVLAALAFIVWGVAAAIQAFNGSAGGMSAGSKKVAEGSKEMETALEDSGDHVAAYAADVVPQFFDKVADQIGPKIRELLGNIDIGESLRNMIGKVKADAVNWAQDFIDIGTNLIDGISTAISNPDNVEKVKASIKALGEALLESFKLFFGIHSPSTVMAEQGGFILDGLVQGLMNFPSKLAGWVSGIGDYILNSGVGQFFTGAIEKGKGLVDSIGEGLQNGKEAVKKKAAEIGKSALEKVGKAKEWGKNALKSATTFGQKLQSSKNIVARSAGNMVVGATNAVKGIAKHFGTSSAAGASAFSASLKAGKGPARAAGAAIVAGAKSAFNGIANSFRTLGKNAAEGFRNGIHNMISRIADKAREMVRAAKNAAKSEQNSSSPSKDFMEYGNWAAQGYAIGMTNRKSSRLIEDNARKMVDSAKNIASSTSFGTGSFYLDSNPALRSLAYAMAQISDTLDDSVDTNPMIRPVMDMSNVSNGAAAISALFGDKPVNVDMIGSVQNDFNRAMSNRANAFSLDSIDKLARRIGDMTDTMNSRSLNNYITVDGATDPNAFADELIRSFRLNTRMA